MKLKKLLMALALPVAALTFVACGSDDDDTPVNTVPTQFTESLHKMFPNAKGVEWETKGAYRVAEFKQNNNMIETDVWFDNNAANMMVKNDYGQNLFLIPANINDAIVATKYASLPWKIDDIEEYIMPTQTFYVIEAEAAGQPDTHIFINSSGQIVKEVTGTIPDITPDYKL